MDHSLRATKNNIGLGYGDAALIGQQIMRCLEYELGLRDAEIAKVCARVEALDHTAAALMVNLAGADAYLVMRRMGHSSYSVTYDRYAKLFPERDAEIIAGLEAGRNRALADAPSKSDAEVVTLR